MSHQHGRLLALLQFAQKVLTVKLVYLLNVPEDHVSLPSESLRDVLPHEFRDVVLQFKEVYAQHAREVTKLRENKLQRHAITSIIYSRDLT